MNRFAIILILLFASGCGQHGQSATDKTGTQPIDNSIVKLIKSRSVLCADTVVKLTGPETDKTEVDSMVMSRLRKSPLFRPVNNEDHFQVYYYSYMPAKNENYFPALFLKSTESDCGTYELILTHFNRDGYVTDALPVAMYMSPAECLLTTVSKFRKNELFVTDRENCDNGSDDPTYDSTVSQYIISDSGIITFVYCSKNK